MLRREVAIRIIGDIVLSDSPSETLKAWRERFHITQAQLAKKMGVSPSVISDYESGRRKSPGINFIKRYVLSLIELDEERGSNTLMTLAKLFNVRGDLWKVIIDLCDFKRPITIGDFCKRLGAELLTCPESKDIFIMGYTLVDSIRLLFDIPSYEYLKLYGTTTQRAAIFAKVERGRSPIVAVKAMQAVTGGLRPALIMLHGPKSVKDVDEIALIVAKREELPVAWIPPLEISDVVRILKKIAQEVGIKK
ncbi:MAG: transcriptional regulator [Thermoprotei archaeon]|nr:MAG: transcriptional regulator [Thermoprotei archaeon]RLF20152.1 MAG: transcriptional regulator [Thermoprotei archaeon]